MHGEADVLRLLELIRELRRNLTCYRGETFLPGIDEMIARLSENPPDLHGVRSLYRTLYQSKTLLADFHVEPGQAIDWVALNGRLDILMRTIAARLQL